MVTGISTALACQGPFYDLLQWGPVVVTGIRTEAARVASLSHQELQWGPVVVTGISILRAHLGRRGVSRFNGVRSW